MIPYLLYDSNAHFVIPPVLVFLASVVSLLLFRTDSTCTVKTIAGILAIVLIVCVLIVCLETYRPTGMACGEFDDLCMLDICRYDELPADASTEESVYALIYLLCLLIHITTLSALLNAACCTFYDLTQGINRDKIALFEYYGIYPAISQKVVPTKSTEEKDS